jgi:hypothetical protein
MTVEISFPVEFVVHGVPVSLQVKRADARANWRDRIRRASLQVLPEGHFATKAPVAVTLLYFPDKDMQGDIDNIVKPILDALGQHIYLDDRQVERVWVQKFEPDRIFPFSSPSPSLTLALRGVKPLLYVRVSNDPAEGLM